MHTDSPLGLPIGSAGKNQLPVRATMPRAKLTKSAIDALPIPPRDTVYWDNGCPGFGVKVTPKGRQAFLVLYRGAGSRLRKYTLCSYVRGTLRQARAAALKIFAARTEGRDPAAEK